MSKKTLMIEVPKYGSVDFTVASAELHDEKSFIENHKEAWPGLAEDKRVETLKKTYAQLRAMSPNTAPAVNPAVPGKTKEEKQN